MISSRRDGEQLSEVTFEAEAPEMSMPGCWELKRKFRTELEDTSMKSRLSWLFLFCAVFVGTAAQTGWTQAKAATTSTDKFKIIYITPHSKDAGPQASSLIKNQASTGQTIALWNYSQLAYDGKTYSGTMVGRSPFAHGHRVTTIPTFIIPVIFTFQDTGTVFDPTKPDPCAPKGDSVETVILQSPLFQPVDFIMNGVDVGTAQYLDAFQRGNFWSKVGGTPYHTVFKSSPTILPVSVKVGPSAGQTQFGSCGPVGLLDINQWDSYVQTTLIPSLASKGVGPANFPQFLFDSVAMYLNGDPAQCCALGYHNSFMNGGVFQTYSANMYDTSGAFGGDTSVMSHEIAEWMDDPNTGNPVPAWGAEGQVTAGSCQNNLEVGDPLSPGFGTPTNPFSVLGSNGIPYTLQELAFYSWFLGTSPSLGAGGGFSDNGTFTGHAILCPPGGTN